MNKRMTNMDIYFKYPSKSQMGNTLQNALKNFESIPKYDNIPDEEITKILSSDEITNFKSLIEVFELRLQDRKEHLNLYLVKNQNQLWFSELADNIKNQLLSINNKNNTSEFIQYFNNNFIGQVYQNNENKEKIIVSNVLYNSHIWHHESDNNISIEKPNKDNLEIFILDETLYKMMPVIQLRDINNHLVYMEFSPVITGFQLVLENGILYEKVIPYKDFISNFTKIENTSIASICIKENLGL